MLGFNELFLHTLKQLMEDAEKETSFPDSTGNGSEAKYKPLDALRIVVLDIETTGFKPAKGDEIISVGACVMEGGKISEGKIFNRLVNPRRDIPFHVAELTGITNEMAGGGGEVMEVLDDLLEFMGDDLIAGHALGFDLNFINYKLKQKNARIHNCILDICIPARILCPGLENYSLDSLLSYFSIHPSGRHTALGDALLTAYLLEKFIDPLKDAGISSLSEIEWLINHFRQDINFHISF